MKHGITVLLLAGCYRSPGVLTELEADAAARVVAGQLSALPVTHAVVPPITRLWAVEGFATLEVVLEEDLLGCAKKQVVCDAEVARRCEVDLEDCDVDLEGAFTILDLGDAVGFCWGVGPDELVAPMQGEGGALVWGSTIATPMDEEGTTLEAEHTLVWSPAGASLPAEEALAAQCGSARPLPEAIGAGAVLGRVTLEVESDKTVPFRDPEHAVRLVGGSLALVVPESPFDPLLAGDAGSTCRSDGDCVTWSLATTDLAGSSLAWLPEGEGELTFATPERDLATLRLAGESLTLEDGDRSFTVDVAGGGAP